MAAAAYNASADYTAKAVHLMSNPYFVRIVVSLIILLIGLTLARILARIVERVLKEIELNSMLKAVTGSDFDAVRMLSSATFYFIVFFSVITTLNELGIAATVMEILGGAVLLVLIIAFALGVKDFIPNSIAGLVIYRKGTVKKGDRIRVKDLEGVVESVTLNETHLMTDEGDLITIPNASLIRSEIIKVRRKKR